MPPIHQAIERAVADFQGFLNGLMPYGALVTVTSHGIQFEPRTLLTLRVLAAIPTPTDIHYLVQLAQYPEDSPLAEQGNAQAVTISDPFQEIRPGVHRTALLDGLGEPIDGSWLTINTDLTEFRARTLETLL